MGVGRVVPLAPLGVRSRERAVPLPKNCLSILSIHEVSLMVLWMK